ncbi:MAG: sigma-70 family RNA polymerase sigma factor [Planctomycetota bacterium]
MAKPSDSRTEAFVTDLAKSQNRLYAYIYSLVADHSRASDVLQETNLVLWRKIDDFDPQRPFLAWATGIARFQVMAHFRDMGRDQLLVDEELASQLAEDAEANACVALDGQQHLKQCLGELHSSQRKLIEDRYFHSHSITHLANQQERTEGAVRLMLFRIRKSLAECIRRAVSVEGGSC